MNRGKPWTNENKVQLIKLHKANKSPKDISLEMGRSKSAINSAIKKIRINQHFNFNGSRWTQIHKPIKKIELHLNCDSYDEDKYVKIYMAKYGIDNVRGGSYCTMILDEDTKKLLQREIDMSNDRCYVCKQKGHFGNKCIALKDIRKPIEYINKLYLTLKSIDILFKTENVILIECYSELWVNVAYTINEYIKHRISNPINNKNTIVINDISYTPENANKLLLKQVFVNLPKYRDLYLDISDQIKHKSSIGDIKDILTNICELHSNLMKFSRFGISPVLKFPEA